MNGFEWIEATGWMSQIDICEWIGLTCSASKLVISMKMDNNNLRGNLPLELSFLKILSSLHLVENFIEGTFPSFLNDLPQLQEIDLSGNLIDDAFPGGIVKLNATLGKQK
jgi:Leucine-rich repeat (LRR) protein